MDTTEQTLREELDALVGRGPRTEDARDEGLDDGLDAVFGAVAADTIDRRPRVRDRLRELPTPVRIGLALLAALIMTATALALTQIRADLSGEALLRYGLAMGAIAGLVGVAFGVSMRGMHQKPPGPWVWAVIVVGLGVPLGLALWPSLWAGGDVAAVQQLGGVHVPCALLGVLTGALTAGVAWLFQRRDVPVMWRSLAAVSGGGLTAFAMLQLHCPTREATHLLVAHAGVGLMLASVVAVLVAWRRGRLRAAHSS